MYLSKKSAKKTKKKTMHAISPIPNISKKKTCAQGLKMVDQMASLHFICE
jgi:hypothetical protein